MIIIPERLSWFRLLFRMRDTINLRVYPRILIVLLLASIITYLHQVGGWFQKSLTALPFTFIGLALSIFLGFRNSACYDRFWEGRKQWGSLINTARNLSRLIKTWIQSSNSDGEAKALQVQMIRYVIAFSHALRAQLRGDGWGEATKFLSPEDALVFKTWKNPPLYIVQRLSEMLHQAYKLHWIDPHHVVMIENALNHLVDVQGSCERIRNTPVPFAYVVLLHQLVGIYCFFLPFGIIDTLEVYTPFVTAIVAYAFMGMDAIGDSIENPFQLENHDLPLSAMCRTIEVNLLQSLGETHLPPLLTPDSRWVLL